MERAVELVLFEYAVVKQPKRDKDGEIVDEGAVVVEPTTVLARSQQEAELMAGRAIPQDEMAHVERLTLVVRPF